MNIPLSFPAGGLDRAAKTAGKKNVSFHVEGDQLVVKSWGAVKRLAEALPKNVVIQTPTRPRPGQPC